MTAKKTTIFDKLFRDANGKVVIWQNPNIPLLGWIVFTALGLIIKHGAAHTGFHRLAEASLFTWAYLEIRSGKSLFRRILGCIVLVSTLYGFFRA